MVVATNPVWYDISCHLNGRMSAQALHTFVYRGTHGIKEKLGFGKREKEVENDVFQKR